MSARPRTPVTYEVPSVRSPWVSFSWRNARPVLNTDALRVLEDQWRAVQFTGAAIVHALDTDLANRVCPRSCDDHWLTLNVLLRVRGSLLLGDMPTLDSGDAVFDMAIATDDPRLARLATGERDASR